MILETDRLILREMTINDFEDLYEILKDSDVTKHYPYTFDEQRVRNWILKNIDRYEVFGFGLWGVVLKENKKMIGDCGITMQNINGMIKPEIGYHINKKYWRNGYGKEAATKCRDWIFENSTFNIVYSYMQSTNLPSYSLAMSIGMKKVDEYIDGETKVLVYAITRKEWESIKKIF